MERQITYSDAMRTLGKAAVMFFFCVAITLRIWKDDTQLYVRRHYLAVLMLTSVFIGMVVMTMQARAERDLSDRTAYQMEVSRDSLQIIVDR